MFKTRRSRPVLAALLLLASAAPALPVRPVKSIYTALDPADCREIEAQAGRRALLCDGLEGFPIVLAEDAERTYVSVGPDGQSRRAAKQTLPVFNSLFHESSRRTAIEWRFTIRDRKPKPYAMIVRYYTKHGGREGQELIITRITDTEACHVAYIDAIATPNAIAAARRIADEKARTFDCRSEPMRVGAPVRTPM